MYNFDQLLILFSALLFLVVLFSFINEKTLKLPYEIGLVVFGFIFVAIYIVGRNLNIIYIPAEFSELYREFDFTDFLFKGILCFMLFSGASRIKFGDFKADKFMIGSMAVVGTLVSTVVYGLLFFGLGYLIHVNISLLEACILGAIVAPTDPISAMSILAKAGLPKRIGLIIEGEALFNDGVAVAIFATLLSALKLSSDSVSVLSFLGGLTSEILGAVTVGFAISFLLFEVFKRSNDNFIKIFTSILTVMLAYLVCEYLGFSGPIAAVICGLYYASGIARHDEKNSACISEELLNLFYSFWSVVDNLLNGMLFLLVGVLFLNIKNINTLSVGMMIIIGIGSVVFNTIARMSGVWVSLLFNKNPPEGKGMKNPRFITFMTWAGLKGGLCLALIMGTSNSLATPTYNLSLVATYAIVLFTTVVQGLTVGKGYIMLSKKSSDYNAGQRQKNVKIAGNTAK
ncbi:cation:proton antiporter [Acetobacterium woodii]|uniref:Na+/H+ antiporter NhaP n=1 Tax=Acetobacterium woodii (strain ATCC 29683 / DSM 1030 / JCM 2381 / KCTC 1655 / WB1) TaxID=931626 RepID=H6LCJ9_ACEWD|nr:cation:proton antiporter [Acetobacterium woodii]AFA47781.1 Na+/H+ antiporter NhaP [Acetobacterium woodii DSM 1030]